MSLLSFCKLCYYNVYLPIVYVSLSPLLYLSACSAFIEFRNFFKDFNKVYQEGNLCSTDIIPSLSNLSRAEKSKRIIIFFSTNARNY